MVIHMATTIAVKDDTLDMLKSIREETGAESLDETIKHLVASAKKPKKSFFGRFRNLGTFEREEIDRFD